MRQLRKQIDELFAVHHLCISMNDGIQYSVKPWKLFLPSSFVNSFISFNTMCSFNWPESFTQKKPIEWETEQRSVAAFKSSDESSDETQKFYKYIDLLDKKLGDEFPALFDQQLSKSIKPIDKPDIELMNIVQDKRIDQELADSFQKHFGLVWGGALKGESYKKSIKEIAYFVYQVMDNILHGGKYTLQMMDKNQQNRLKIYAGILTSLNHLLFDIAERELHWERPSFEINNPQMGDEVSWAKVFIWSGFDFEVNGNEYTFKTETWRNREYLAKILHEIGYDEYLDTCAFKPSVSRISKNAWLEAVEMLHERAEAGDFDDLIIMDTYMGGIIRVINEFGFETIFSCDGHGTENNVISLQDRHKSYALDICLKAISKGKYGYEHHSIVQANKRPIRHRMRAIRDRDFLLDVAELLHQNKAKVARLTEELLGEDQKLRRRLKQERVREQLDLYPCD